MYVIKTARAKRRFSLKQFYHRISRDHLFESSATLSYYFLFSVFPFTIFISAAFSTLRLSAESFAPFSNFIPSHILSFLENYLKEISLGNTASLITLGFLLTVYSMGKAIQTMRRKFRRSYRAKQKNQSLTEWFISFLFVILVMISFYAMMIIIVLGNRLFLWLGRCFPFAVSLLPSYQSVRVIGVTCYLFFVLVGLYYVLPGIRLSLQDVIPGTLFSLVAWVTASYLFSFYLEIFGGYTSLYGSIGTIIALLIWLFMINMILLLGSYLNAYFYHEKNGRNQ
ncbi:MAG: YihY/virulence factor BrkB family protein [Clostridia bacterium]|nr:YihY/virulence factor BrkB family protein [Clostridia bacterium]